ncbi:hypothetical protein B0H16DRAFT_1355206 [Mycena metata]|uniref:Uncharacterized protein n=1 Tax=Mycena metata TaxID=1033252 RepID=A0AAD7P3E6_9AGAR|nr:hypothetical protein B0H16DRAFT_1355206 [Mycena metata]
MLKRRAISPPPGSAIPLVSDPPDSYRRESKRRRILPPSLDGQSRRSILPAEDEDGEEDDEDDVHLSNGRNPFGPGPSASPVHNTEYESANTFLHDLHALQRHRLIFSSSSPPFLQPDIPAAPHTQDKSYLSPMPDFARTPDKKDPSGMHDFGCGPSVEEVQSVKERYEDTNKLLGSLFLTRRKQLDPHQYNT